MTPLNKQVKGNCSKDWFTRTKKKK